MDVELLWDFGVDAFEELFELHRPVARVQRRNDGAVRVSGAAKSEVVPWRV